MKIKDENPGSAPVFTHVLLIIGGALIVGFYHYLFKLTIFVELIAEGWPGCVHEGEGDVYEVRDAEDCRVLIRYYVSLVVINWVRFIPARIKRET